MPLRIIFMGTPEFSVPTLAALAGAGHKIVAVYTQPPRPGGRRGLDLQKSPVHQAAELLGIEVLTPVNFKDAADRQAFRDFDADVAVVVAYGLLLPEEILSGTRLGCYNGHASLLPRWRGAAPIQRAIMAGDHETGMMVMKMDKGLDTGDVALTKVVAIGTEMTAGELHDKLMLAGAGLMKDAMERLDGGELPLTPQAEQGVLYAAKISKAETRIDFSKTATEVHNHIRGLSPFPGAWFELETGGKLERIKVLSSVVRNRRRRNRNGAVRRSDDCLRRWLCAADPAAEGRRQGVECGRLPARHARSCRYKAVLMPRFRMTIEYDGSNYVGWQRQDNGPSVQGAVEKAILALTREPRFDPRRRAHRFRRACPWPGGACGSFARLEAGDVAQCTERLSRPGWTTGVDHRGGGCAG